MSTVRPSVVAVGNTARSIDTIPARNVIKIGSKPKPAPRRHKARVRQDPRLIFILAHQTILRWEFAARRLELPMRTKSEGTALRAEVELGLGQLHTVRERLRPFNRTRNLAVRFESEEVMVRLDELEAQLAKLQQALASHTPLPLQTAREVGERLIAKARGLGRG